jgi:hypothetical protein
MPFPQFPKIIFETFDVWSQQTNRHIEPFHSGFCVHMVRNIVTKIVSFLELKNHPHLGIRIEQSYEDRKAESK